MVTNTSINGELGHMLARVAHQARSAYAERVAGTSATHPWWSVIVITASSQRQAQRYEEEIHRRQINGTIPSDVRYLVVPDMDDVRIGSGGATINALHKLGQAVHHDEAPARLADWWARQRVLIIHAGGDARRLPQYSLSGKLFSALPITTPWGEVSTVFDELLVFSTPWAQQLDAGLVITSGDVLPTFDGKALHWDRPGVSGVAMPDSYEVGSRHGVFIADDTGRVYTFLQKPTMAEVCAAGGLLPDEQVAVDTGVMRFDVDTTVQLMTLAGVHDGDGWQFDDGILTPTEHGLPEIDLYEHITQMLTGQWTPAPDAPACWHELAAALQGVPFWCDLVAGELTHVGTTTLFRQLMTEETTFSRLYEVRQRLGIVNPPGLRSAGVIIDSILSGGGEIGPGALAIECMLSVPIRIGRGAILHGLADLSTAVEVPDDTVAHQVPIHLPNGQRGVVMRVYGVCDDPKGSVASRTATWFGRPILESLELLGIDPELVWPGLPIDARTLWNARLFPIGTPDEAWACARWMLGLYAGYSPRDWAKRERYSLASSAQWADTSSLDEARGRRMQQYWSSTALSLAEAGSDLRPLLAHTPGLMALAETARALWSRAALRKLSAPTDAASMYMHASRFFGQAGLADEASRAYNMAFTCVQHGVDAYATDDPFIKAARQWQAQRVTVAAPARIDFGGGWTDTPPFCLDWGGTVLNMAVQLNGQYPISTVIKRIDTPVIRCVADGGNTTEYSTNEEIFTPPAPGDVFAIPRAALQIIGLVRPGERLPEVLQRYGGGLEICTAVNLPMGSGLGTSSILAATMMRAIAGMLGLCLTDRELSDQVMRLEQRMATGGGWQDQAGGIFTGTKLIHTGPGLQQRLRVQPLAWDITRQQAFEERFVLYYTGIRRIARNLLAEIVGRYLARESATVQVLHSIKTLALEMSHAMCDGEWTYLGQLLDRHWHLNQQLDPHTTNAPINALLQDVRPYLAGAKLAGAGGGGFVMMLAKDVEAAGELRERLATGGFPGELYNCAIADEGLRITTE